MMKINIFLFCLVGLICLVPTGVLSKDDTCCPSNSGFNCICEDNDVDVLAGFKPPCTMTNPNDRCPRSYHCVDDAVSGNTGTGEAVCCQDCGEIDLGCIDFSNTTEHCGFCGNYCPHPDNHTEVEYEHFCESYECCDGCGMPPLNYVAEEDNYITGCPDQIYDAKFCGSCNYNCFSEENLETFRDQVPALSTSSKSAQEINLNSNYFGWESVDITVQETLSGLYSFEATAEDAIIYTELAAIYKDRTRLELIFQFTSRSSSETPLVTIFFAVDRDGDIIRVAEEDYTFAAVVADEDTEAHTLHLLTTFEESSQFAGEVIVIGFSVSNGDTIYILESEGHEPRVVELNSHRAHWFSRYNLTATEQDSRLPNSVVAACAALPYVGDDRTTFWNAFDRDPSQPDQFIISEQQYVQSTFCGAIGCNNDTSSERNSPCCPVCDVRFTSTGIATGEDISHYKGDFCIDLFNDNQNCGVCGNLCENIGDGFTCHGGRCCDACGTDECKDLETDVNHCGHCDVQCDPGTETCSGGSCVPICPERCRHCVKRFTQHSECEREVEWTTSAPSWCLDCCDGCCDPAEQTCSRGIPFKIE